MHPNYTLALAVVLVLLFTTYLPAQTQNLAYAYTPAKKPLPPTSLGLFIGLTGSELVGNYAVENPERAPGMDLYFHVDCPVNQVLGIRPELRWVFKGGSMIVDNAYFDINLQYVEIPVSLTASYRFHGIRLYAMAGPTLGFTTSSRYLWDGYLDGEITDIEPIEIGYTYGVGVAVYILAMELRFGNGITDIVEDSPSNNFKNKYFSVTFGIGN